MPLTIVRQDITNMQVDAIVNAANTQLLMGGGVCGAIFRAAGARELQAACDKAAPIETGGAAITPGFRLPAKYVIHAAGPVYRQYSPAQSERYLYSAYWEALTLAKQADCESVAFPLISSGIYGYPNKEALQVAERAILDFIQENEMTVYLAVFDREAFSTSKELMGAVQSYIDDHYVAAHPPTRSQLLDVEEQALQSAPPKQKAMKKLFRRTPRKTRESTWPAAAQPQEGFRHAKEAGQEEQIRHTGQLPDLSDMLQHLDEPFSETLLRLIDEKGMTDVEVYKRANIDRRLFSKIRAGKGYTPKKPTILALAIALQLTLPETDTLLARAGYAFSPASKFDVIVQFFIVQQSYDIFTINEVLCQYDQQTLGV